MAENDNKKRKVKKGDPGFEEFAKQFAPIVTKATGSALGQSKYTNAMLALYNAYNSQDDIGKGLSAAQATSAIAAEMGSKSAAEMAPYIGYITAAYNIFKTGEKQGWDQAAVQAGGVAAATAFGAWAVLPAMAVAKGYGTAKSLKKKGVDPGEYTDAEYDAVFYPDLFGEQKLGKKIDKKLPKVPLFNKGPIDLVTKWLSPMGEYSPLGAIASKLLKSGKHEDQVMRDRLRDSLEKQGFIKRDAEGRHAIQLADGTFFDVGRDGQASFKGVDGKDVKFGYESDHNNPLTGEAIGMLQPLLNTMAGGRLDDKDGLKAFEAQIINAAVSNAKSAKDVQKNVRKIYQDTGITKEMAELSLGKFAQEGKLSEWERLAGNNGLNSVFDDNYDFAKARGAAVGEGHKKAFDEYTKTLPEQGVKTPEENAMRNLSDEQIQKLLGGINPNVPGEAEEIADLTSGQRQDIFKYNSRGQQIRDVDTRDRLAAWRNTGIDDKYAQLGPGNAKEIYGQFIAARDKDGTASEVGGLLDPGRYQAPSQAPDYSIPYGQQGYTPRPDPNAPALPTTFAPAPQVGASIDPWFSMPKSDQERADREKQWQAFKEKYPDGVIQFAQEGQVTPSVGNPLVSSGDPGVLGKLQELLRAKQNG